MGEFPFFMYRTLACNGDRHANKLVGILVITLIFSVTNETMFNVALPEISKKFSLLPSVASWIMTSYIVAYAIGSVILGKLADKYRLKDLLTSLFRLRMLLLKKVGKLPILNEI